MTRICFYVPMNLLIIYQFAQFQININIEKACRKIDFDDLNRALDQILEALYVKF